MSCSEWKEYRLDEVGDIVSGGTPSTKNEDYYGNEIPWITPKDLSGYYSKYISKGERSITKLGLEKSSAKLLPKGTILFSSRAPIGYVAIAQEDLCTNQGFKNIVCNPQVAHNEFIYYRMKLAKEELESVAGGSTFKEVSGKVMKEFKVKLPSIEEQKRIASILSSLDDKIELNNEMNKTLEEMAQSIYKRWFVDFEFPNEDGQPYKSSGGEMVESELGMIPKGWEVGSFSDISEILDSKRIPLSKREREKRANIYPYYGAASLMDYVDDYIFEGIHVLMGEDGTVIDKDGFPILQYVGGKFWVNNHAHVLKGKNEFSNEFVYLYLSNTNVTHLVTGAVQPKINQKNLTSLKLPIPDKNMTVKFNSLAKNIFEYIYEIRQENKKLEEIRSILLPVLMNGTINIK